MLKRLVGPGLWKWLLIGLVGGSIIGVSLLFIMTPRWQRVSQQWLSKTIVNLPQSIAQASDGPIFIERHGVTQKQARSLYSQAYQALKQGQYINAARQFEELEAHYPGLLDLLLLHQAEAYEASGNTAKAKARLARLLRERGMSPLRDAARYQLGQAFMRGRQFQQADEQFQRLHDEAPDSDWGVGSLYYLGVLAQEAQADDGQSLPPGTDLSHLDFPEVYWFRYLSALPEGDGRFSSEVARQLDSLELEDLTPAHHVLLGKAYGADHAEHAAEHFQQASLTDSWLAQARVLLESEQKAKAQQVLKQGLKVNKDSDKAYEGINLLLKSMSPRGWIPTLQRLTSLPIGGDIALYKIALLSDSRAPGAFKQIVERFPDGDYAPEASWFAIRRHLKAARYEQAKQAIRRHDEQYPTAYSTRKALFWLGKLQEKTDREKAIETYHRVQGRFPYTYYAFRAAGRLQAIESAKGDPGWQTEPWVTSTYPTYPPVESSQPSVDTGNQAIPAAYQSVANELKAIGALSDLSLYLNEAMGEVPAVIQSWTLQRTGNQAEGLRVLRDAIKERQDEVLAADPNADAPKPTIDELKLLYPAPFTQPIAQAAQQRRLDPFLIQALMRQESYFNPTAMSSSNAMGLMQLLVPTAREVAGWNGLSFMPEKLFLPDTNILLGSHYLGYLHSRFNGNSMLSVGAYNGGPNAMQRWVTQLGNLYRTNPDWFIERIPYEQSRSYIQKVYEGYWNYRALYGSELLIER